MTALPDPHELLTQFGIVDPRAVTRIPGGFGDSAIWRVETSEPDSQILALRLFGAGDERGFHREAAAMRAARPGGCPIPAVLGAEIVTGRPVMLLEWCPGRTMMEEVLTRPERAWALGSQLGDVHGRLHTCDPDPDLQERGVDWISWMGTGEPALQERLTRRQRTLSTSRDDPSPRLPSRQRRLSNRAESPASSTGRTRVSAISGPMWPAPPRSCASPRSLPASHGAKILRFRRTFRRSWRLAHRRTHGYLPDMELFDAWALAAMVRDLGLKVGRDNAAAMGLSEEYFESLSRALDNRKRRLGLV